MNRILFLILIALSSLAAHATTLFIDPSTATVTVGDTVTVNVDIFIFSGDIFNPDPGVYGFDLAIQYPSFLTYVGVTEEGYFGAAGVLGLAPDSTSTPGYILQLLDTATDPDPAVLSVDTLFSITFQANDTGNGPIQIVCDGPNDCTNPMLADASFNSLPVDTINGATVTSVTPEPSFAWVTAALGGLLLWRRRRLGHEQSPCA